MATANNTIASAVDWRPITDMLLQRLRAELAAQDHNATGKLSNSIELRTTTTPSGGFVIEGLAEYYSRWVNNGRQFGKQQPPINAILQWMNTRNIAMDLTKSYQRRGLAFVIARSIADKGIPPLGGYSDHYSKGNSIDRLNFVDKVLDASTDEIAKFISDNLGNIIGTFLEIPINRTMKFIGYGDIKHSNNWNGTIK